MRSSFKRCVPWLSALSALLLLLFGAVTLPLHAQAPSVTLDAEPLYGGLVKYGEWLPVQVEVQNQGEAQSGQIRIPIISTNGTHYHAQQVELAAGAHKAVTIPVIVPNSARHLKVEWLPDGASEPALDITLDIDAVPNIRVIAASITGGGEGLNALDRLSLEELSPPREVLLVPLDLQNVPDRPELLDTLDVILLSGVDTTLLTPAQSQALEAFVARDGLLVLGGGPGAARVLGGLPETLQPVALSGERALDALPALAEWGTSEVRVSGPFVTAVATPAPDAITQLEQDGLPLVVERAYGAGMVYWLALDPALSPFDAWAGAERFWQRMWGERLDYPNGQAVDVSPRQQLQQEMGWLLREMPVLDLPSIRLLVPLLAIYILVVGPLNYLFLRRRGRLEWAWATIPLATLVFSVGAYGLGFQLRGSDIVLNTVSLVQAPPGSSNATVYGAAGLFSPAARDYTLSIADETFITSVDQADPWGRLDIKTANDYTILHGNPTRVAEFRVGQWEMKTVGLEKQWQIGGPITAELALTDDLVTGTLHNASELTLRDATLVMQSYFVHLGDLAPGTRMEVNFPLSREAGDEALTGDLGWRIFQNSGTDRSLDVRRRLFTLALERSMAPIPVMPMQEPMAINDVSPLLRNATLRLIAWPDTAPLEVALVPQGNMAQIHTTMLIVPLPLQFQGGSVNTPEGYLSGEVVEYEGGSICYPPGAATPSLTPDYRSAEIQWGLPDDLRAMSITSLAVYLSTDLPDQEDPDVSVSLLDVTTQEWTPIELAPNHQVAEGARFVTEEGLIRLRAENQSVNMGGCHFFDLRVRGQLLAESDR